MIVGAGKTGISCANYFSRHGIPFSVMDSDATADKLAALRAVVADAKLSSIDQTALLEASEIILSPGVPLALPEIAAASRAGVPITGDVAMFAKLAGKPVAGITGSNGKSTVTAFVGGMARASGMNVGVGGNIGTPCLDLLEQGHDMFVIEVSSYQLEVVDHLDCDVAVVLNLSPDHLNRYPDVDAYFSAKAGIYRGCRTAVLNRALNYHFDLGEARVLTFSADEPASDNDFGMRESGGQQWLARGTHNLFPTSDLRILGAHNHLNALAAIAVGTGLGLPLEGMLAALREFPGLPHRCELAGVVGGATYINDSKATNPASTLAAIKGFSGASANLILILGGQGKSADFSVLQDAIAANCRQVFAFGQDRSTIASQLSPRIKVQLFETLDDVMTEIFLAAKPGESVLFSPACASLDQFRNFERRGDTFKSLVRARQGQ